MIKNKTILYFCLINIVHSVSLAGTVQEVSLESDKAKIESLRKDIPPDIKAENEELGTILRLFEDKRIKPASVRSRFEDLASRKRRDIQKKFQVERDNFNRTSKLERDQFMKIQKDSRDKFFLETKDAVKRKNFIDQQSMEREKFFLEQQDKRKAKDEDIASAKKNEEEKIKDLKKEFDENYKIHERDYNDRQEVEKAMRLKKPIPNTQLSPENESLIQEFNKIPKTKGEKIGPE